MEPDSSWWYHMKRGKTEIIEILFKQKEKRKKKNYCEVDQTLEQVA